MNKQEYVNAGIEDAQAGKPPRGFGADTWQFRAYTSGYNTGTKDLPAPKVAEYVTAPKREAAKESRAQRDARRKYAASSSAFARRSRLRYADRVINLTRAPGARYTPPRGRRGMAESDL